MGEKVFAYDAALYDRRFLNCWQRHALVFLLEQGVPADLLLYGALISSDSVMEQVILSKRPKYEYDGTLLCADDLRAVGVELRDHSCDRFGEARGVIVERLERAGGFVLLKGDVFYFPHCPEHRSIHLNHFIVLREPPTDGGWSMVDDNAASVLCEYEYDERLVADFFENNGDRRIRWFDVDASVSRAQAASAIEAMFERRLGEYHDSLALYEHVGEIVENRYDSLAVKVKALHDAFSLLSGSRACLGRYLEVAGWREEIASRARELAELASVLKNLIVKGGAMRRLDANRIQQRSAQLMSMERELHGMLRSGTARSA